jgi:hypothetical protein
MLWLRSALSNFARHTHLALSDFVNLCTNSVPLHPLAGLWGSSAWRFDPAVRHFRSPCDPRMWDMRSSAGSC